MNERIQKLAEQAGLKYHNWITNESNVKDSDFKYPRLEDYEKFAELIVEECVNLMENQKEHYYSQVLGQQSAEHYDRVISKGDAFDDAVTIIRSHFRS